MERKVETLLKLINGLSSKCAFCSSISNSVKIYFATYCSFASALSLFLFTISFAIANSSFDLNVAVDWVIYTTVRLFKRTRFVVVCTEYIINRIYVFCLSFTCQKERLNKLSKHVN